MREEQKVDQEQTEQPDVLPAAVLLFYLSNLEVPEGYGWMVYKSTTGRGWRLATVDSGQNQTYPTPREAITAAIRIGLY